MRQINLDHLETERIDDIQHVRDSDCKGNGVECFICVRGWMQGFCGNFRLRYDGLWCDEKNIALKDKV